MLGEGSTFSCLNRKQLSEQVNGIKMIFTLNWENGEREATSVERKIKTMVVMKKGISKVLYDTKLIFSQDMGPELPSSGY